jgi:alpha-L-fucosidase
MAKEEDYKKFDQVLEEMVRAVAFGGNFLMNVGPKANGELCEFEEKILQKMSLWMKIHSHAILSTKMLSKQFPSEVNRFGVLYFTQKRDTNDIFVFLFFQSPNSFLEKADLQIKCLRVKKSLPKCVLLGKEDHPVKIHREEDGVRVSLSAFSSSLFENGVPVLQLSGVEVISA